MKIIVDEIPKKPRECIFAEYDSGYMYCRLSKEICDLEICEKCNKLLKHKKEGAK